MVAALALVGAALFILAGLAAAARRVHIGNLDAQALAEKLSVPYPLSALDWPELRIRAVVPQPGRPLVVVLLVGRLGFDEQPSTMLVRLDGAGQPVSVLSGWCANGASVSPSRRDGRVELRRRQSLERVSGSVLTEDVTSPVARRRGPDSRGSRA